jgi:hypothetical protein
MKKAFLLLTFAMMLFVLDGFSQKRTWTGNVSENSYGSLLGVAARDTLVASDTIIYNLRVQGAHVLDMNFGLHVTKVSGTVTNNWFLEYSIDNVTWTKLDTIALSNASTGMNYKRIENFNWPYLRFYALAGATAQKAHYKLWYIIRRE